MHNIATIYKFKTPFINSVHAKAKTEAIIEGCRKLLLYDAILDKIENKSDAHFNHTNIFFKNKRGNINISYLHSNNDINYLPVFKMDIFIERSKWEPLELLGIINNIFAEFDGLSKNEYILDIDPEIYRFTNLGKYYNFKTQTLNLVEQLQKDYKFKKGEEIIKEFIKQKERNPELEYESLDIYKDIFRYVIYLVYIYYKMIYFILQSEDLQKEIEYIQIPQSVNKDMFRENLNLIDTRLDHLKNIGLTNFRKYGEYLDSFFKLFNS